MIRYLIWLQLCLGYASIRAIKALDYFKSAENIYNATNDERAKSCCFTKAELKKLSTIDISKADEIIDLCRKNDISIFGYNDSSYPYSLSVLEDAPLVIYVKGILPDFKKNPTICIVGPRKVSDDGKKAAYSLSFRLSAAGFTVISGGAIGTDTYAHAGALKAGGKTVLCLGCGILNNYLSKNATLREAVANSGCLISEYPPLSDASRYTFPQRNRIMSALAVSTVVVEAPQKSGALITAHYALEQGKEVFAIPGPINNPSFIGSNALLRDGARPLLSAMDIFEEYIYRFADKIDIEKSFSQSPISKKSDIHLESQKEEKNLQKNEKNLPETLSKNAKIVYNYLDKQKFLPEDISVEGLSDAELISALTELEMEFLIKVIPGGMYQLL